MAQRSLALVILLLLSGCAALQRNVAAYREAHAIPPGSQLILTKPLTVAGGRRYLQNENRASGEGMNRYVTYCKLDLSDLNATTLQPDTFTVTRFYQSAEDISLSQRRPRFQTAAFYRLADGDQSNDGGIGPLFFAVFMDLHSDTQPEVQTLACGAWAEANEGQYPTVAQVRAALQPYFQIKRPGESAADVPAQP